MADFLIHELAWYPWLAWLLVVLAGAGLGYVAVWAYKVQIAAWEWLAYRRLVWKSKSAVRRRLLDGSLYGGGCADCRERDAMVIEAMLSATAADDPPEYQHPDGDDEWWPEPGEDWYRDLGSPEEFLRKVKAAGLDDTPDDDIYGELDPPLGEHDFSGDRCANRDCDLYGFIHPPPCRLAPTMPAACYPAMGLKDGPAMPPQDWSGYEASLEVLARGDDDKPLHPAIQASLKAAGFKVHDTTEGLVDTSYTRAMAMEVQAQMRELER